MFCTSINYSGVGMIDLISDGDGGEVYNLSQLDGWRSTAHHWHVMGEYTKAVKKYYWSLKDNV